MSPHVVSVAADDLLREAAMKMRAEGVGALPVVNGDRLVGILSERDVVAALVDGMDPRTTLVAASMTPEPAVATPDETVSEAAFRMVNLGIRHLPVVDRERVVGMVSARDLLVLDLLP